jgi:hypothetical protein
MPEKFWEEVIEKALADRSKELEAEGYSKAIARESAIKELKRYVEKLKVII